MVWGRLQCRDVRTKYHDNWPNGSSDEMEALGLTHRRADRQHGWNITVTIFRKEGK